MGSTKLESASEPKEDRSGLLVPPRIVARVIEVAADPESSLADLAALIGKEPTLSMEMLRAVNSAHYGLRQRIETVRHAVGFMGVRAVRNLVLCIGLQQLVRRDEIEGFPLELFWECSARRAAAAGCLARKLDFPQPDEFFTVGLCLDIGVLAKLRGEPEFAASYVELLDQPAAVRYRAERESGEAHDEIGATLLEQWRLPESHTTCVRFHHRPDEAPDSMRERCFAAAAAEAIADLLQVEDKGVPLEETERLFQLLNLNPDLMRSVVDGVADDVTKAAEMLQLRMKAPLRFDEIVAQASTALLTLSRFQANPDSAMASEVNEQQERAAALQRQNEELARQAATDPLTGLANRRPLDEAVSRELAQAKRQQAEFSVVLLDIDHFKRFNDRHGHKAGDQVLCLVAETLQRQIRRSDLAARYGGEEFAVVLPFTCEKGAQQVAERVRRAVGELVFEWQGERLSVTISAGGATVHASQPTPSTDELIRMADDAMYRAKREGRDCVRWA